MYNELYEVVWILVCIYASLQAANLFEDTQTLCFPNQIQNEAMGDHHYWSGPWVFFRWVCELGPEF